jgi:hypothetical protein
LLDHRREVFMRAHLLGFVVAAGALVAAAPVEAQTSIDVGGDWHVRIAGNHGALSLHFTAPQFGVFEAAGAGYSTQFLTAFGISDDVPQTLQFASNGRIFGALALEDVTRTTPIGLLTIVDGRLNQPDDRLVLRGTLVLNGQPAKKIVLTGTRLGTPETTVTGRTFDGVLSGRRVTSTKMDIRLVDENQSATLGVEPSLQEGFPFFYLLAGGPVRVDGVETPGVRIQGLLVMDTNGTLFGRVSSERFGLGVLVGRILVDEFDLNAGPVFHASLRFDDGRRLRLTGSLE